MADSIAKDALIKAITGALSNADNKLKYISLNSVDERDNTGRVVQHVQLEVRNLSGAIETTVTISPESDFEHDWFRQLKQSLGLLTTNNFNYHIIVADYDVRKGTLECWKASRVDDSGSDPNQFCHC